MDSKLVGPAGFRSKFESTYIKLFRGQTSRQIEPQEDPSRFWPNLLVLNVHGEFLRNELRKLSKDTCIGPLKVFIAAIISLIREADPPKM